MWFDIAVCGLTPLLKVNRRPDTHTHIHVIQGTCGISATQTDKFVEVNVAKHDI